MIYLIGGAPRCGKTILSKKLAAKKKISWISTDSIWSIVLACTPKELVSKRFPYRKTRLGVHAAKNLLRSEITESKTLWPGIKALIGRLIDCREDFVIEGVHLMPELVRELKRTKYRNDIKVLYLIKEDLQKIKDGFSRNAAAHDWLSPLLKNQRMREASAMMVREKSRYISAQARKCGFKVVVMDDDFEKKITALLKF